MNWKHFDNKIYECTELDFDLKIKDISNSLTKKSKIKFSYVRYIFPINEEISIPTVFNWNLGGKKVSILGNWDNWCRKIPLIRSNNDFITIIPLFSGEFYYKFIVDGQLKHANNHKVKNESNGKLLNITNIQKYEKNIKTQDSFSDSESRIISNIITNKNGDFEDFKRDPPLTPPHLASLFKVKLDDEVSASYNSLKNFPTNIHVFLNHLFFFFNKKIALEIKRRLPALRARISEKIINLIFYSKNQNSSIQVNHPLKIIL
nr:AMP-activated protein kinase beta 2 [Cryptomonas curvata]